VASSRVPEATVHRLLVLTGLFLALSACKAGLSAWGPLPADTGSTDTADDSGSSADTSTDSSDTGSGSGSPPALDSFSVSEVAGDLVVLFGAHDPDGDLEGGALELLVNGQSSTFLIPDALDQWTGTSGTVRITTTVGGCGGQSYSVTGSVQDELGHRSTTRSDTVTVGAGAPGTTVPEVGDTLDDLAQLGTITAPHTICGDAWGGGNDGTAYTADLDSLYFTVGATGVWTFELTWESTADDYDLVLSDELGEMVGVSQTDGPSQPESIEWYVFEGESYYVDIGAWAGSGGPWTLAIR
jgi:hypothetical protein